MTRPTGSSKYRTTRKNIQRYYTPKRLIRYIYSPSISNPVYHHVEIFPDHRQYLGFSWRFDSVVKYSVFTVLPFGLSSARYIFTKLVRALVGYWRGLGRRVVMFPDEGIGGATDFIDCQEVTRLCRADLEMAGFCLSLLLGKPAQREGARTGLRSYARCSTLPYPDQKDQRDRPQHRELRALLFSMSVWVL